MNQPLRRTVTVGEGGVIHIVAPELTAGVTVQVDVQVPIDVTEGDDTLPPLRSMLGAGKGCYTAAEEPVTYIRALREECND